MDFWGQIEIGSNDICGPMTYQVKLEFFDQIDFFESILVFESLSSGSNSSFRS